MLKKMAASGIKPSTAGDVLVDDISLLVKSASFSFYRGRGVVVFWEWV